MKQDKDDFYETLAKAREFLKTLGKGKYRKILIREGCRSYEIDDPQNNKGP